MTGVKEVIFTKDIPYLALTGEVWDVFCDDLCEDWPRHDGTAPHSIMVAVHVHDE